MKDVLKTYAELDQTLKFGKGSELGMWDQHRAVGDLVRPSGSRFFWLSFFPFFLLKKNNVIPFNYLRRIILSSISPAYSPLPLVLRIPDLLRTRSREDVTS